MYLLFLALARNSTIATGFVPSLAPSSKSPTRRNAVETCAASGRSPKTFAEVNGGA